MACVVVLGAGVIGLSTALHLLERFPGALNLTIVADKFSPNTTSDKAGAMLTPPGQLILPAESHSLDCKDADNEKKMQKWYRATVQRFHSIYSSQENAQVQLCLQQGYVFLYASSPDPWYKDDVIGFRRVALDSVEASLIHIPPGCVDVWAFGTYAVEPTSYLRWLTGKIRERGAKFVQKKITSFDELLPCDIIINCTGLGSRDLVDDKLVYPVRGQLVRVNAPWIKKWLGFSNSNCVGYVIPRARDVVIGGIAQAHNWNETPDPEVTEAILKNAQQHLPSLRGAEIIDSWVGLRPKRDGVRLESGVGPAGSLLVHCYGHGGEGVILSWGCALDVGDIVQQRMKASWNSTLPN